MYLELSGDGHFIDVIYSFLTKGQTDWCYYLHRLKRVVKLAQRAVKIFFLYCLMETPHSFPFTIRILESQVPHYVSETARCDFLPVVRLH